MDGAQPMEDQIKELTSVEMHMVFITKVYRIAKH